MKFLISWVVTKSIEGKIKGKEKIEMDFKPSKDFLFDLIDKEINNPHLSLNRRTLPVLENHIVDSTAGTLDFNISSIIEVEQ